MKRLDDYQVDLIHSVAVYGLSYTGSIQGYEDDIKELEILIRRCEVMKPSIAELLDVDIVQIEKWADALARLRIAPTDHMFRNRYFALKPFKYKMREYRYLKEHGLALSNFLK